MAVLRVQFDVTFPPSLINILLVGVLLTVAAPELGSENVTMSTYYPAPSGVYAQMLTTNNTYLARDGGSVGIGTTSQISKLGVNGGVAIGTYGAANAAPANGLIVSGSVGIGTTAPSQALQVVGNAVITGGVSAKGYLRIFNDLTGCVETDVSGGDGTTVCPGGYATFTPGLYVEGWSFQNRGGQVLVEANPGQTGTQVWGLNPATGNPGFMTLKKDDSVTRVQCCPK